MPQALTEVGRAEEGGRRLSASEGRCPAPGREEAESLAQQVGCEPAELSAERTVDTGSAACLDRVGCLLFKEAGALWRHIPFLQSGCPHSRELPCSQSTAWTQQSPLTPGNTFHDPQLTPETAGTTDPVYTMLFPPLRTFLYFSPKGSTLWLLCACPD